MRRNHIIKGKVAYIVIIHNMTISFFGLWSELYCFCYKSDLHNRFIPREKERRPHPRERAGGWRERNSSFPFPY